MAQGALDLNDDKYLPFIEACFKKAVFLNPNNSKTWYNLAYTRRRLVDGDRSKAAYRRYFLLQGHKKREKLFEEAYNFGFTKIELDYLLHLELPEPEKSREFLKTI